MMTAQNNTNHPKNQHGKGLKPIGSIKKVTIILGDEEIEVDRYKIVATWLNPKDNNKPTYAFTLTMVVETLLKNGVQVNSAIEAIRIKVNSIYKKCSDLKVYDNTPDNPYTILAWYQDGKWLDVVHPDAKKVNNKN